MIVFFCAIVNFYLMNKAVCMCFWFIHCFVFQVVIACCGANLGLFAVG